MANFASPYRVFCIYYYELFESAVDALTAAQAAYRHWGYRLVGPANRAQGQVMCLERT
jgi:hypothetical protein